jgi:hypothetical protein
MLTIGGASGGRIRGAGFGVGGQWSAVSFMDDDYAN